MNPRTLMLFALVSILWGIPYLLIAEALDTGLGPLAIVAGRVLVGALVLVAVVRTRALEVLRQAPRKTALLAVVEVLIPFTLIAVAERSVTSGTAGVLISLEPFFVLVWSVLLASGVRQSWARILPGSVLGFSGVLLLMGTPSAGIGAWLLIAAAACYALGAVLIDHWFADLPSLTVAAAMLIVATPLTMLTALTMEGASSMDHHWRGSSCPARCRLHGRRVCGILRPDQERRSARREPDHLCGTCRRARGWRHHPQ